MGWLIIGFVLGVLVGYKYPEQVGKTIDSGKKLVNDLKDKITKKETPSS